MEYKINILNRSYLEWEIYNAVTFEKIIDNDIISKILPFEQKLFNNDTFQINKNNETNKHLIEIIHSSIRLSQNIPCILILSGNCTYGRHNKSKLYYKCIPDDDRLPLFLIPYEISGNFSKKYLNKYVTINFIEWNKTCSFPKGIINQIIGDVDILINFYEYQLYCKSLNITIQKFQKNTAKQIAKYGTDLQQIFNEIMVKYPSIQNRLSENIITIDNSDTTDYDDAFGIKEIKEKNMIILSIYISNVSILLDYLNLWDSFSNRVSTIYLPDKKRPMLPTILSDNLCSLKSGLSRIAFTMDIHININLIDTKKYEIIQIDYCNSLICVNNNYSYEEEKLLNCEIYINTFEIIKELSKDYNYTRSINNSHDLIEYLMIFMNYRTALELKKYGNGIYRTNNYINSNINLKKTLHINDSNIINSQLNQLNNNEIINHLMNWNSSISQYTLLNDNMNHDSLNIDAYVHVTSPIRRLVDLLNIIILQTNLNLINDEECQPQTSIGINFYNNWVSKLEYINTSMKNIKKVQNSCNLLAMVSNNSEIYDNVYDGYCFNKIQRDSELFQYFVYLPELKITCKLMCRTNMEDYTLNKYKIYMFSDEDKIKNKIKIQIV